MSSYGKVIKINKTCDQCRQRKVRCIVPSPKPHTRQTELPITCINCANRNEPCHYSIFRPKRVTGPPRALPTRQPEPNDGELYIDRILQRGPQEIEVVLFEESMFKVPDGRVKTCAMAFFSNQRVASLAEKLGTQCLTELVERLEVLVQKRVVGQGEVEESPSAVASVNFNKPSVPERVEPLIAEAFVKAYFKHIHPVYPLLDEEEFCSVALSTTVEDRLRRDPVFSCLYHTVLALGSQYFNGGGFVPRLGQAWGLFQISLGLLPHVLAPPHSLINLQALTAMSVFSLNPCCVQLDLTIVTEAARLAHTLQYHQTANSQLGDLKTFWVVYYLEKMASFTESMSSLLADEDIACMIPHAPEACFDGYNWYLSAIRLGRISSVAYSTLFSASSSLRSKDALSKAIPDVRRRLEDWRLSIPPPFRPNEPIQLEEDASSSTKLVFLQTQYYYFNIVIALERLTLQVEVGNSPAKEESKHRLMLAARTVIELIKFIDIDAFVSIVLCGVMPLAALFILFDFIIHNPSHPDTQKNLVLLEKVATHFQHLERASLGILPGDTISEFAGIARRYAAKFAKGNPLLEGPSREATASLQPTHPLPASYELGITKLHLTVTSSESSQDARLAPSNTDSEESRPASDPSREASQAVEQLNYPTDDTMEEADASLGDLRNLFGWVFPDWGDVPFT